jgi:hypothetical protein
VSACALAGDRCGQRAGERVTVAAYELFDDE